MLGYLEIGSMGIKNKEKNILIMSDLCCENGCQDQLHVWENGKTGAQGHAVEK